MAYTFSQLENLWTQAGGSKDLAPTMAAIALAESGGDPNARNPSGASGLWQILGPPFGGNVYDPLTNARMAVAKYHSQGLGAWTTYTSGDYLKHLPGTTFIPFPPGVTPTTPASKAFPGLDAGGVGGGLGGLTGAGGVGDTASALSSIAGFLGNLFDPKHLLRLVLVIVGIIGLVLGVLLLYRKSEQPATA